MKSGQCNNDCGAAAKKIAALMKCRPSTSSSVGMFRLESAPEQTFRRCERLQSRSKRKLRMRPLFISDASDPPIVIAGKGEPVPVTEKMVRSDGCQRYFP